MSINRKHQVVRNSVASYFNLTILAKNFVLQWYQNNWFSLSKLGISRYLIVVQMNGFCCTEGQLSKLELGS